MSTEQQLLTTVTDAVRLTAGARAVAAAGPDHVVWLGAYGTGPSARRAGPLLRTILTMLGDLDDKVTADAIILEAGGTVFHSGPLSHGPIAPSHRTTTVDGTPRRLFPSRISRATVAAAILDEAENPAHAGRIAVPLRR
ncbi:hypothetical protein J2S43_002768 [Catenuloplanes nepalensis]|uniref:Uncharacterized protein n=1 Tax=Catenuloplanes nepalensis TaxID=587533 RepID=A0ABT9MTA9_9ACTN|nr:hypothetical protein [Catenuloplanes nepalensis]MDP9794256.1 hypothetical protein [Catenuloplanes nepalensis]